jgi:molecular chaperone DnaJ
MPKNYYLILGVGRGADIGQIKKAYRQIAKKYHPDISRSDSNERFRELQEAYETLADVEKRRQYDRLLKNEEAPVRPPAPHVAPAPDVSQFQRFSRFESFIDEFFEGFVPGFFQTERFKAPRKDLYFEVILSADEALRGGLYPIRFPVGEKCPDCNGYGRRARLVCQNCGGRGAIQTERTFSLSIPPRTSDGTQVTLSLEDIGLAGVDLHIRVQVDPLLED